MAIAQRLDRDAGGSGSRLLQSQMMHAFSALFLRWLINIGKKFRFVLSICWSRSQA